MPWRFRVPLLREIEPPRALGDNRLQGQPRRRPKLFGKLATDRVDDVDFALLERGEPRRLVGDRLEHQAFDAGGLAPILVEGLENQLQPGRERNEFVRARTDRRFFEAFIPDLLDVVFRDDPARTTGRRVEGQKVGPRPFQLEAHVPGIGGLDRGDPVLDQVVRRAAIALERAFDVVGSDRLAIVELRAQAQDEFIAEPVLGCGPRFGEA